MIVFVLLVQLLCCHCDDVTLHNSTVNVFDKSANVTSALEATSDTHVLQEVTSPSFNYTTTSDLTIPVTEDTFDNTIQPVTNNTNLTSKAIGHISKAQLDAIKRVLWLYVVPVILPFGIFGSILGGFVSSPAAL